jgi:hypothetical protein
MVSVLFLTMPLFAYGCIEKVKKTQIIKLEEPEKILFEFRFEPNSSWQPILLEIDQNDSVF